MATVFATNANVFTSEHVSALKHRVVSWGWRDPSMPLDRQREAMLEETRRSLRRFEQADDIARAYHSNKVLLGKPWRGVGWVLNAVRSADRVLVGAPLGGADRILWVAAYLGARSMRKPVYIYSEVWIDAGGPAAALQRRVRRAAERVLVPGQVHRDYMLKAGVEPERVEMIGSIYCPSGEAERLLPLRREGQLVTLLYVGRFMPIKGLERLLGIVARLLETSGALRLVAVSGGSSQYMGSDPGYPERCRALIEALPDDRVEVIEHVDEIEHAFDLADVLVMPNRIVPGDKVPAESWGRVVEEALLHGLPVVGTDAVPAVLERVVDGVNGRVVPWRSDEALESALAGVIARDGTG